MRRGIWLAQPFASQSVVDFCRALPKQMRANRMLNVLTLARAGLSDGFILQRYFEHYANVILHEAAFIDFDEELSESRLADYGIIDIGALLLQAREGTRDGLPLDLVVKLWLVSKLEAVLGRYLS
jgi:hypothetical protein